MHPGPGRKEVPEKCKPTSDPDRHPAAPSLAPEVAGEGSQRDAERVARAAPQGQNPVRPHM